MTDLKISQFTDGGLVQSSDDIAAVRSGTNTKVSFGTAAAEDVGTSGDTVPKCDTANTFNLAQTLSGGIVTDSIQTSGSSGVAIKNSGGTTVLTVGSANSTNSTFAGALNINGSQAATSDSNTQTLTNKTISSGRYNQLLDTNGNVMLGMTATASAVNYINITNNVAGANPILSAAGNDSNINLNLTAKGTGAVRLIPGSGSNIAQLFNGAGTAAANISMALLSTSRNFTLPDTAMTFAGRDVAQTFTGLQTMSAGVNVGNVAQASTTTLDWYEEGSFTPTAVGTTIAGVGTYTTQVGRYTRVGRLVTVQLTLGWSAHTGTGNLRISGLPFTSSAIDQPAPISYYDGLNVGAGLQPGAVLANSSTNINIYSNNPAGAAALLAIDAVVAGLYLNVSYIV